MQGFVDPLDAFDVTIPLPLGFLTGLFGVNVAGMPGTDTASAFWTLIAASVASGVVIFLIFKFSKWL